MTCNFLLFALQLSLSARKKTKMKTENTDKDDGSLKPNGKKKGNPVLFYFII
jgi:hypothetical protein